MDEEPKYWKKNRQKQLKLMWKTDKKTRHGDFFLCRATKAEKIEYAKMN